MEAENKISQDLIKIIIKHSAFEECEINKNTSLNLDYKGGMSHYDAILFFNDLYDRYDISFPEDFDVTEYFYKEGIELPKFIKILLGIPAKKENSYKKNITVGHIVRVIKEQKWIEP